MINKTYPKRLYINKLQIKLQWLNKNYYLKLHFSFLKLLLISRLSTFWKCCFHQDVHMLKYYSLCVIEQFVVVWLLKKYIIVIMQQPYSISLTLYIGFIRSAY